MQNVMLAIHLMLALFLIAAVLIQRSEGGGLGIGGGGNAKPAAEGGLDGMQKLTWSLGAAFMASSIFLAIIAASNGGSDILDQLNGLDTSEIIEETVEEGEAIEAPADPNAQSDDAPALPADPNASN